MSELLNKNEISKILTRILPEPGHRPLLAALKARYPSTPFSLIEEYDGRTWDVGIIDSVGNRVNDELEKWIDQELTLAGGSAQQVWLKHKDSGLIRTERVGSVLYLVASFGPDLDQFYQLEILNGPELTTQKMFDPFPLFRVEDRQDLVSGPTLTFSDAERRELTPAQYQLEKLVNIRRLIHNLSDSKKTNRLFHDWRESSAGREGFRIHEHWWMETNFWTDQAGKKQYSLIPRWAEADGGLDLPVISPEWESSPYAVMESLQKFDKRVGYPFAWYFYALHGNRISHSAAGIIANAIKKGLLNLPAHDEKVLLRWRDQQYGF